MFAIPLVDVSAKSARYARSAMPAAPVIEDRRKRPLFALVVRGGGR
jgi:hypothetical protein